jgi:hypothetical protein
MHFLGVMYLIIDYLRFGLCILLSQLNLVFIEI